MWDINGSAIQITFGSEVTNWIAQKYNPIKSRVPGLLDIKDSKVALLKFEDEHIRKSLPANLAYPGATIFTSQNPKVKEEEKVDPNTGILAFGLDRHERKLRNLGE